MVKLCSSLGPYNIYRQQGKRYEWQAVSILMPVGVGTIHLPHGMVGRTDTSPFSYPLSVGMFIAEELDNNESDKP